MAKLTPKQARFVAAYDGNGAAAARAAGYKGNDNTLKQVASENLAKPDVAAAIAKRETKVVKGLIATREERQEFWSAAMRGEVGLVDRLRASELLGKSESDFVDKQQHEHVVRIVVVDPYAKPPVQS